MFSFDLSTVSTTSVNNLGTASGATGTLNAGASIDTSNLVAGSGALTLSGSNQFLSFPTWTSGSTGLSIACWFRSNGNLDTARIFDMGNGGADNIILSVRSNGLRAELLKGATVVAWSDVVTTNINDDKWRYVVWTMDTSGTWIVYLNGAQVFTKDKAGYPNNVQRGKNYIGKSNWIENPYFKGKIDDFRIYNSVLSASDVSKLYTSK